MKKSEEVEEREEGEGIEPNPEAAKRCDETCSFHEACMRDFENWCEKGPPKGYTGPDPEPNARDGDELPIAQRIVGSSTAPTQTDQIYTTTPATIGEMNAAYKKVIDGHVGKTPEEMRAHRAEVKAELDETVTLTMTGWKLRWLINHLSAALHPNRAVMSAEEHIVMALDIIGDAEEHMG